MIQLYRHLHTMGAKILKGNMAPVCSRLLTGAAMVLCSACDSGGDKVTRTFPSPDHDYVAVLVTEVGGGFPGASCVDTVFVVPGKALSSGRYPASSRAYAGGCHTLKMVVVNGQRVMPNAPGLRWTGPRELSIAFVPKLARLDVQAFYSATSLYGGAVKIRNEPQ
jgi:hypothetical protein